jgi:hypothetical protein
MAQLPPLHYWCRVVDLDPPPPFLLLLGVAPVCGIEIASLAGVFSTAVVAFYSTCSVACAGVLMWILRRCSPSWAWLRLGLAPNPRLRLALPHGLCHLVGAASLTR